MPLTLIGLPRDSRRSWPGAVLLLALAGAALLNGAALPHVHEDETAGLYDEDHVYVSLATVSGIDVPLAEATVSAGLAPRFSSASTARHIVVPSPFEHHAASRAPPVR